MNWKVIAVAFIYGIGTAVSIPVIARKAPVCGTEIC